MARLVSIPEFEGFEWDEANAGKNWEKHRVSPGEAEELFFNEPLVLAEDETHSSREKRFRALGQSDEGRSLFAVFTLREGCIRVVSVRDMSRKERRAYRSS